MQQTVLDCFQLKRGRKMDSYTDTIATLNAPAGVSVTAHAHGINRLTFQGRNGDDVSYEIWRRHGDSAPWGLQATIRLESYTDTHILGGQYYEYKVRAISEKAISEFSGSVVVYGKT